jgi:hypothetical protein
VKLIIKSIDGTSRNTTIFDADTGEEVRGITRIECQAGEVWKAHIELLIDEVDILAHVEDA